MDKDCTTSIINVTETKNLLQTFMQLKRNIILASLAFVFFSCNSEQAGRDTITPVPFNQVNLEDSFWLPRLETQYETLVPFALDKTKPAVENFRKAANYLNGVEDEMPFPHRYISSDLFKVMEGVAYILMEHEDPALEKKMDEIIDLIGEVQQEDGYLYVAHITGVAGQHDAWGGAGMGDKPYSYVLHSHELYNMGHMYEAAIAYYQATGKDKWIRMAEKNAQHINKVFFEGDPNYNSGEPVNQAPGHQEIELALTKLYRVTGNELYLNMAKKFLDIRGVTFKPEGEGVMSPTYAQQHAPVTEQKEAVGHAVRAAYMYSSMADVGALTGDDRYNPSLNAIWHDIVDTKMHITGGLGAIRGIEGFGPKYILPNKDTYNETCAAVGNVLFNFRMFLNSGEAKYLDVAEIALFNNSLAGVNLDGNRFFYVNPLEADGETPFNHGHAGRSPWFNTACCPSNIARLMPQVPGLMYAHTTDEIFITLYGSSSAHIPLKEGAVKISQKADYPFDGTIKIALNAGKAQEYTLKLRIPTWSGSAQFLPGDLYHYVNDSHSSWEIKINGETTDVPIDQGFASITRIWEPGDEVELHLPMEIRFNAVIDSVENNRNRLAVTRGPLVYAAEEIDHDVKTQQLFMDGIPDYSKLETKRFREGKLKNIIKVQLPAKKVVGSGVSDINMTLIPYYAWNNRGIGSMTVWLPTEKEMMLK